MIPAFPQTLAWIKEYVWLPTTALSNASVLTATQDSAVKYPQVSLELWNNR